MTHPAQADEAKGMTLTKADTVALWHAIDDMTYMHIGMKADPPCTPEQLADHQERITAARLALRKVNAIRKAADGGSPR